MTSNLVSLPPMDSDEAAPILEAMERAIRDMAPVTPLVGAQFAYEAIRSFMPRQGETTRDVTLVLRVTTAYEQGYGDGDGHRAKDNPYAAGTNESEAWNIGWQTSKRRAQKTSCSGFDANGSEVP